MLMLTLDDAVKVAKRLVRDGMNDEQIIRQEMEQKCWFPSEDDDTGKLLFELIQDINPAEICSQIESENLRHWCEIIQTQMMLAAAILTKGR